MTKKEMGTQYSGLILFAAKLITVGTGIAFTLVVANSLSQDEYGVWGKFNIIIPYFTILSGAVTFWTMRFVARDKKGATKTGIAANSTVAVISTLIYLALMPVIAPSFELQTYATVYIMMGLQIVELYLIAVFEANLQARRPHFVGYGMLVGEILKVTLAYVFILRVHLGLLGVVLSVVIAFAVKAGFYFRTIYGELRQKINFGYIREWLKGSTFNIYNVVGDRIAAIIFLMLAIYGGDPGTSLYTAAVQIANIIAYSTYLAFALQPRLLANSDISEATVSLKMVLMFAVPMTAGVLALPSSYLIFMKESGDYVPATPILTILAIDSLILTISAIFTYVLFGMEKVDEKAQIPFKEVMKSRLFIAFSLPYVHSAITLPAAFYALTTLANNDPVLVGVYVTGINTVAHFAMFLVLYYVLRRAIKVKIPWVSIGKYVAAAAIMAVFLFSTHPARRSSTLVVTGIGGAIYLGVLLAIDKDTRLLIRAILQTLKDKARTRISQTEEE